MKMTITVSAAMKELLDLQASTGYISEEEKLERNDSKINLFIQLLKFSNKKIDVEGVGLFARRVFIRALTTGIELAT